MSDERPIPKVSFLPGWVWVLASVLIIVGAVFSSSIWLFVGLVLAMAQGCYMAGITRWPACSERLSASMRFLTLLFTISTIAIDHQREFALGNLWNVPAAARDKARSNWEHVEQAFQAKDSRALKGLIGCQVLIHVEASGSPWNGKVFSNDEREAASGDAVKLEEARTRHEELGPILKSIEDRKAAAWHVKCRIAFTRKQVRRHFSWPDMPFSADFEVLGTLTEASIAGQRIWLKPTAIQPVILQL